MTQGQYQAPITMDSTFKGYTDTVFQMVNLDLSSIKQRIANNETPFKKICMCNLGNPLAVGNKEMTSARELNILCLQPEIAQKTHFPKDLIERSNQYLADNSNNSGCYSATEGLQTVREEVAAMINKRDGTTNCKAASVYLTNGASEAINYVLRAIIRDKHDAVFNVAPGFPAYSAAFSFFQGCEIQYYLDEDKGFRITEEILNDALQRCIEQQKIPRCVLLINPSNPVGVVHSEEEILTLLRFCYKHNMCVIADEVYQHNIYKQEISFVSARSVLYKYENELKGLQIFSLNSISKSVYSECGRRGGYFQTDNIPQAVLDKICDVMSFGSPNFEGMAVVGLMCNPPKEGDESYPLWKKEFEEKLTNLTNKSKLVYNHLKNMKGIRCIEPLGALYVFPRIMVNPNIDFSPLTPDEKYCQDLLNEVGVLTVPGKMFGQKEGTYHLRMTILPDEKEIEEIMERWDKFNEKWMEKYGQN